MKTKHGSPHFPEPDEEQPVDSAHDRAGDE
jgi:hypothetical protein